MNSKSITVCGAWIATNNTKNVVLLLLHWYRATVFVDWQAAATRDYSLSLLGNYNFNCNVCNLLTKYAWLPIHVSQELLCTCICSILSQCFFSMLWMWHSSAQFCRQSWSPWPLKNRHQSHCPDPKQNKGTCKLPLQTQAFFWLELPSMLRFASCTSNSMSHTF